jgi:hypothetical protein
MATQPLTWTFNLGGIGLSRFEVPPEFEDGVDAHLVVHRYINESGSAATKIHSLGAFPLPTTWNARLYGANALSRHFQLKRLAAAGKPFLWTYGPLQYTAAIQRYSGKIHHQLEIYYTIDLIVIAEKNSALPQPDASVSFDVGTQAVYDVAAQAMADLQTADLNLSASVLTANANATSLLLNAYPLKLQPLTTILKIISAVNVLLTALQAYTAPLQQNAVLEADLARLEASLRALDAFSLLMTNLQQLLGQSATATQVTISSGDLFSIAAQYYPGQDVATVAASLAGANGLSDYFITTPMTLVLPPVFT